MTYTPSRGVNPCRNVTKKITGDHSVDVGVRDRDVNLPPRAIPRTTHRVASCPAAIRMLERRSISKTVECVAQEHYTSGQRPEEHTQYKTGKVIRTTYDTSSSRKAKNDGIHGKDDSCQILWAGVNSFQINLLSSTAGEHCSILEPDEQTAKREHEAENPEHQRCADRAHRAEDGGRCGQDTSTDDAADTDRPSEVSSAN